MSNDVNSKVKRFEREKWAIYWFIHNFRFKMVGINILIHSLHFNSQFKYLN